MLIGVFVEEVQEECQATDGMLMTFDSLSLLSRMHRRFMRLLLEVTIVVSGLLLLFAPTWTSLRYVGLMLMLYSGVSLLGISAYRRAVTAIRSKVPARLVGLTLGQLDRAKVCSVTFTCLICNETTTLELKDGQYERLAPGAIVFAHTSNVAPRHISPVKKYRLSVEVEHGGRPVRLYCRLERKDGLKLDDLMLRFLGGLMYEKVALQLESELKRIAQEFAERPLSEFVEFIRGFGLELEGMPYRARVTRVKEVKVKPANSRAGQ